MRNPHRRFAEHLSLSVALAIAVLAIATSVSAADADPPDRGGREAATDAGGSQTEQSQTPASREAAPTRRASKAFAPSKRLPVDSPVSLPTDI